MTAKTKLFALAALVMVGVALWAFLFMPRYPPQPLAAATESSLELMPESPPAMLHPRRTEPHAHVAAVTNNWERFSDLANRKLTSEQAEMYLRENHRNAASLLAASRASGDKAYLREAMEKYPNDPRVAFDAYFFGRPRDNLKPATPEQRQWLDSFKQSDPNNALPNYLAARDDFKQGQAELALQELKLASGKPALDAYLSDSLQNTEEAYRAAGFSEADAKSVATWNLLLPHLSEMKKLGENLTDLAIQYQQSGDNASAQAVLQMGLGLGKQVGGPPDFTLISSLVGVAIQKKVLGAMNPADPYLDSGLTVQDQLDSLNRYRESVKPIAQQEELLLPRMSDADRVSFYDRLRWFGEPAALQWAVEKFGKQ